MELTVTVPIVVPSSVTVAPGAPWHCVPRARSVTALSALVVTVFEAVPFGPYWSALLALAVRSLMRFGQIVPSADMTPDVMLSASCDSSAAIAKSAVATPTSIAAEAVSPAIAAR